MSDTKKFQDLINQRTEAHLPAGLPNDQVRTILDRADAEGFVQSLDPQVLFQLIRKADWEEARELVPLASPWQVQVFVDLDGWSKDRFTTGKVLPWIESVLELADDAKFKRVCRDTDAEILAMIFKKSVMVAIPDEDGLPPAEMTDLPYETSPDGVYFLVYPQDEDQAATLRRMVSRLYELDRVLAWTLLEAARWELFSAMEEEAYRWRNSRLEEFGFVSREEAMEIYAPIDPVKFRKKVESNDIPEKHIERMARTNFALMSTSSDDDFFFFRALNELDEDVVDRVVSEFVVVQNRTMLADGVEPGQLDAAREIGERTVGYTSVGLEFLSYGDLTRAGALLARVPLKEVFRTGFALTRKLGKTAAELKQRPTLSLIEGSPFSLVGGNEARLLEALSRSRPSYVESDGTSSWFTTQAQIEDTVRRVAYIAFKQLWLFGVAEVQAQELAALVYGGSLLNGPPEVTFDVIFTTFVAQTLIGAAPEPRPLTSPELKKLPPLLRGKPWKDDPVLFFEPNLGPIVEAIPASSLPFATRWIQDSIERLADELDRVMETPEPGLMTGFLLVTNDA